MKKLKLFSKEKIKKVTRIEINSFIQKKTAEFLSKIDKNEVYGNSPPEVFVGRIGYPKVYVGPLLPPTTAPTEYLGMPEKWWGKGLKEIISMRLQLLRGKKKVKIVDLHNKLVEKLREMLLSKRSVETEMKIKSLSKVVHFSRYHQPFGPSAIFEDFNAYPSRTNFKLEKVFYDTDLKATEAIIFLYSKGLPISKIQQAFSMGMMGVERNRKLAPTRWSITAVDDALSKNLIGKIKHYPEISEYRVYFTEYLDNKWVVFMFPGRWEYEFIEAWFPGTLADYLAIGGDYEDWKGRKTYASIGGCYYASRLAVAEKLEEEKRQASVLVLREVHPGYLVPVGVWNVRESVRRALKSKPQKFEELEAAIKFGMTKLSLPFKLWLKNSKILKKIYEQTKFSPANWFKICKSLSF